MPNNSKPLLDDVPLIEQTIKDIDSNFKFGGYDDTRLISFTNQKEKYSVFIGEKKKPNEMSIIRSIDIPFSTSEYPYDTLSRDQLTSHFNISKNCNIRPHKEDKEFHLECEVLMDISENPSDITKNFEFLLNESQNIIHNNMIKIKTKMKKDTKYTF